MRIGESTCKEDCARAARVSPQRKALESLEGKSDGVRGAPGVHRSHAMRWSGDLCCVGEFSPLCPSGIRQRYECPRPSADMRWYGGASSSPRGHLVLGISQTALC